MSFGSLGSVGGGNSGSSLSSDRKSYLSTVSQGALIASLSKPFGTGTTYATVGTVPGQLVLSNGTIIAGAAASALGTTYPLKVRATSADGKRETAETLLFTAASVATLTALTLSTDTYVEGLTAGAVIATIGGGTAGSTVSLIGDAGGRIAKSTTAIVAGLTSTVFSATPSVSITLRQSLAGYPDRDQVFDLSVTRVALPTVTISSAVSHSEGNSGTVTYTYTVTRSTTSGATSVPYSIALGSTNASDYPGGTAPVGGNVVFASGAASGTIVITVRSDVDVEPDEIFTVTIAAPSGYAAGASMSATGTIVNDDTSSLVPGAPVISVAQNFGVTTAPSAPVISVAQYFGAVGIPGAPVISVAQNFEASPDLGIGIPAKPAGFIDEITTFASVPAKNPQWFIDAQVSEMNDTNNHPHLHTDMDAVKDGDYHDPTVWSGGSVPTADQSFNVGNFNVAISQSCEFKDCHVGGSGSLRVKMANPTTQVVVTTCTPMNHGISICGTFAEPIPFMSDGRSGVKWVIKPRTADGITVEGGVINMGPARWIGVEHAHEILCVSDLAVGQTVIPVSGIETANWPIGMTLLIPGTDYIHTNTDSTYHGPTSYQGQYPNQPQLSVGYGYAGNTSEEVILKAKTTTSITIETVNTTGGTGLKYKHENMSRTHAKTGVVNSIFVPIIAVSKPIEVVSQDPSSRWKKGHFMHMLNPDAIYQGVRCRNLGRTNNDPTLKNPDGPLVYAQDGVTLITDINNVRGRYGGIHIHFTGWESAVVIDNCYFGTDFALDPGVGWGSAAHVSKVSMRRSTAAHIRGAGHVWEMGGETGEAIDCNAVHCPGDGYGKGFDTRAENLKNSNGHYGVGFEMQSRNILMIGCRAWQCNVYASWLQQDAVSIKYNAQRMAPMQFQRYYDPLAWNTGGIGFHYASEDFNTTDGYGTEQAQIPPSRDCAAIGCREGIYVEHRWNFSRRDADEMGVWHSFNTFNTQIPINVPNYTGKYVWMNGAWVNGYGSNFGNVSTGFSVVSTVIDSFPVPFSQMDWNYDGFYVDLDLRNCGALPDTFYSVANTADAAFLADPKWDTMEPRTIINSTVFKIRTGKNLNSSTDLPQAFPAAPAGAGGVDPIPGKARPYMWVDTEKSNIEINYNNNQFKLAGYIVDHLGTRRIGDMKSSESGYYGIGTGVVIRGTGKPAAYFVQQFGCFLDNGTWKCRLWFPINDRFTATADAPVVYEALDVPLINFPAQMLTDNARDPALTKPADPHKPEWHVRTEFAVPAPAPIKILTPSAISAPEGKPLEIWLRSDHPNAKWAITGGSDAADFEIAFAKGKYTLRFVGNVAANFDSPADSDGDNVYQVTYTATEPFGGTAAKSTVVTVLNKTTTVGPSTDPGASNGSAIEDSPYWTQYGGTPNITRYSGAFYFAPGIIDRVIYMAPDTGSINNFAQLYFQGGNWPNYAGTGLGLSLTDENNYIAVFFTDGEMDIYSVVAGTSKKEFTVANATSGFIRAEYTPGTNTLVIKRDGTVIGSGTITAQPPITSKVGLTTAINKDGSAVVRNFSAGPL